MKLPWLNTLLTLRKQGGGLEVPELDSTGRIKVQVANSVSPTVGNTPPANPTDGDLWYNNTAGWETLFVYNDARTLWLSSGELIWSWGHDSADNTRLRGFDVHTAGVGTALRVPRDATIVRVVAYSRAGNSTKTIEITIGGVNATTFSLSSNTYKNNSFALNVDEDDQLWVETDGTGPSVNDIVVNLYAKWRYAA